MRYSVSLSAEGDREVELDEVLELADAVAMHNGIASGYGTFGYGAQVVVEAQDPEEAVRKAVDLFTEAVKTTSLPAWPIVDVETISEDEDFGDLELEP
jgi:uncharacterized protein with GYD domain